MTEEKTKFSKIEELFGADLRSLAFYRVGLALLVLTDLIVRATDLKVFYTDAGVLPRAAYFEKFVNPWLISALFMNGQEAVIAIIFCICGLFAIGMLVGYKTKFMTICTWFLLMSIQERNIMVNQAGDILFRMMFFWAIFLPLGAKFSIDSALNSGKKQLPTYVLSMATVAAFAQVVIMYWFTTTFKSGIQWREEGSAIFYALNLDGFASPIAIWLRQFPLVIKYLTYVVYWYELVGPLLLFPVIFIGPIRTLAIAGFVLMHIGFGSCLYLGNFPWIDSVSFIAFLPAWFWDNLIPKYIRFPNIKSMKIFYDGDCNFCKKMVLIIKNFLILPDGFEISSAQTIPVIYKEMQTNNSWVVVDETGVNYFKFNAFVQLCKASPLFRFLVPLFELNIISDLGLRLYECVANNRSIGSKLTEYLNFHPLRINLSGFENTLVSFSLFLVFWWNLQTLNDSYKVPAPIKYLGLALGFDQRWGMFAPFPDRLDGWYVIPGKLRDGTVINVYNGGYDFKPDKKLDWKKPPLLSHTYKNTRWRKYHMNLKGKTIDKEYISYFARYTCKKWNSEFKGGKRLDRFRIFFVEEMTLPSLKIDKPKPRLIWEHYCYNVPSKKTQPDKDKKS